MNHRATRLLAVVLLPLALLAACGDDDEGDVAAYCDLVEELDAQEEFPSDEQLDELRDVAPDEIQTEIDLLVDRVQEDGEAAFEDPEVTDAIEDIEAYEVDACGREDLDPADEDVDDSDTEDDDETTTTEGDTTTTSEDTTTTSVEETTTTAGS